MEPDSSREKSSRNVSLGYFHGVLVPHHPVITYYNNEYINGFDLTVSRYISETKHINPPEMGAGYYFSNLGSKEIYGYAHALYFFISRDFLKNSPNLCLRSSISIGASYNTLHWDITDNY